MPNLKAECNECPVQHMKGPAVKSATIRYVQCVVILLKIKLADKHFTYCDTL